MSSSFKRHRAPSHGSSTSSTSTTEAEHPSKASRIAGQSGSGATGHPLLCTLPPTCNHKPTPLANSRDLEVHYATYHAHVCEQSRCGAVFPDSRLLELHQTECHDPLAAVRKDRGEKIFACHLTSCARFFSSPKTRRLHLIQAHGYPKEYFFAVTNKGVGGLLKKWGEGASMIRGEWKVRETNVEENGGDDDEGSIDGQATIDVSAEHDEPEAIGTTDGDTEQTTNKLNGGHSTDTALDGLADTMGSLSLVPPSIRFGRGGRKGGFLHPLERGGNSNIRGDGLGRTGHRGRGRGRGWAGPHSSTGMDIDPPVVPVAHLPLGRAGRGRAGIIHRPRGRGIFRGVGVRGGAI